MNPLDGGIEFDIMAYMPERPRYSGRFLVRIPKSLHAALVAEADTEGVSLNQLCVAKLSVPLSASAQKKRRAQKESRK